MIGDCEGACPASPAKSSPGIIKGNIGKTAAREKEAGFTIVEVMIVLAIAGLILAIVFIAVPALQRNSRDSQRRADMSALQSAIATYVGNNNGQIPDSLADLQEATAAIDFSFYNERGAVLATQPTTQVACQANPTGAWAAGACTGATAPPVDDWAAAAGENQLFFTDTTIAVQTGTVAQEDFALYIEGAVCTGNSVAKGLFPANGGTGTSAILAGGPARSYAVVYATESDANWICIDNV